MSRFSGILAVIVFLPVASVWAKPTAAPAAQVLTAKVGSLEADKLHQDLILSTLVKGNADFKKSQGAAKHPRKTHKMVSTLPLRAMVLTCSDAVMDPERLFDSDPGEIFSVRVAGNVASPEVVASLEYGAQDLGLPVLVVLGHQSCPAVRGCLERLKGERNDRVTVNGQVLLQHLTPACQGALTDGFKGDALLQKSVTANVKNTIRELLEESPELWELQHQGKLRIVGAVCTASGEVKWLE